MPRFLAPFFFALLPCLLPQGAVADIFKYVDGDGHVFYTDNPKHAGFKRILTSPPAFSFSGRGAGRLRGVGRGGQRDGQFSAARMLRRQEFAPMIDAAASKYSLDPALLHAVIQAESGYNPGAVSNKGAAGLMQLMPATARRLGVRSPFDPRDNIRGGAAYLAELAERYGETNADLILAAYNAGEHAVEEYGGVPPYRETRDYVKRVLALWVPPARLVRAEF